jgi:hypothetical protein
MTQTRTHQGREFTATIERDGEHHKAIISFKGAHYRGHRMTECRVVRLTPTEDSARAELESLWVWITSGRSGHTFH